MTEKNNKLIHLCYSVILSVSAAVTAVLLIVSCVGIYNSSDSSPFNSESISKAFGKIAVPVCIFLILAVGGFILNLFSPLEKKKNKGGVPKSVTLKHLSSKLDLDNTLVEYGAGILIRRRIRPILTAFVSIIFVLRSIHSLIYILNPENFPALEPNSAILKATITVGFNLALPFVFAIIVMLINSKLVKDEIELTKKALTQQKEKFDAPEKTNFITKTKVFFVTNEKTVTQASRALLIVCAIIFIGVGIWNGGASDIVKKAIKICTECIGLG